MKKEKKEKAPPAKFWNAMVATFFDFVAEKFGGERPTFDGSAPRDLKAIVACLEKRAEVAGVEWNEQNAITRLRNFLTLAHRDQWLQQNFVLSNINRQKDKIFLNAKAQSNGTTHFTSHGSKPTPTIQPKGSFGKL